MDPACGQRLQIAAARVRASGVLGRSRLLLALFDYLVAASLEQRARSNAFDREEMSPGGNVHRLILDLVNGG